MPDGGADFRGDVGAGVHVETAAVALIGKVWLVVVFKAIDPAVVVGVNAVEKFGPIDVLAEKRLLVVWNQIDDAPVVVLVEVGNEIVVFVPPRKDGAIDRQGVVAAPIRDAVLIVVILNEFDQEPLIAARVVVGKIAGIVVDEAVLLADVRGGGVIRVHAECLGKKEIRLGALPQVEHEGVGRGLGGRPRRGAVIGIALVRARIGILAIRAAVVPFAVQVKALDVFQREREPKYLRRGGQAVLKRDDPQIGVVLDVARGTGDHQEDGVVAAASLAVGRGLHFVVVAQHQVELDFANLRFVLRRDQQKIRAVEVVAQADLLVAVGRDKPLLREAAFDDRFKPNFPAAVHAAVQVGDDDVRARAEKRRAAFAIGRRVVAEQNFDPSDGFVLLIYGQFAGEGIAAEAVGEGIRLVGVDKIEPQRGEIAHLNGGAPPHQRGVVGAIDALDVGARAARFAQPRIQEGEQVFVRGEVELDSVEIGLGKGHGRQGGADAVANGEGVVVLADGVRGDEQAVEPSAKAVVLEQLVAALQGLALAVVEDEPAAIDEIAKEVVEIAALQRHIDVALVGCAGVVGVLPLPPAVLVEELLRDVPLFYGRVYCIKKNARTLWLKRGPATALDAQPTTVVLG